MSHSTLISSFWIALLGGLSVGGGPMFLWARKILRLRARKRISIRLYMWPGIFTFLACCVPAIYLNHLLKQEDYCESIIRANRAIQPGDPFLRERCGRLDVDALFRKVRGGS